MDPIPPQLIAYLQQARAARMLDDEIRADLLSAGWPEQMIAEALTAFPAVNTIPNATTPPAAAATLPNVHPRRILVIGLAIMLVLIGLGYLYTAKYWLHSWPFAQ